MLFRSVTLAPELTLAVQSPPNLLPNLQFLRPCPAIIEQLIPGRPVNDIHVEYFPRINLRFPIDIMLRALRQPFTPVTTLSIRTDTFLCNEIIPNIVQALPKLRQVTLEWPGFEVRQLFEDKSDSN